MRRAGQKIVRYLPERFVSYRRGGGHPPTQTPCLSQPIPRVQGGMQWWDELLLLPSYLGNKKNKNNNTGDVFHRRSNTNQYSSKLQASCECFSRYVPEEMEARWRDKRDVFSLVFPSRLSTVISCLPSQLFPEFFPPAFVWMTSV